MDFINTHRRKIFIFMAVILIVAAAITGTNKFRPGLLDKVLGVFVVPIQNGMHTVAENVGSLFAKKKDVVELREENETLKSQIADLIEENKRLSLFEEENIELSNLLDINRKYPDYEKIGVQIISTDTSNWYNVFTIDRGSADGLKADMFVVAEGGLVGRIFEVSSKYSKVMAIIDDRNAVHGQSKQTEDIGVVKGNSYLMQQGLCSMEYIDLEAEISVGDEIITSVYSEIYPAGITIGYVKEINPSEDGLTKTAIITPGVSFNNLNKALALLYKKDEQ